MPMYEYRCPKCGKSFEMLRRIGDADRDLKCPECQSEGVERLISTFSAGGCKPSGGGGVSSQRFPGRAGVAGKQQAGSFDLSTVVWKQTVVGSE